MAYTSVNAVKAYLGIKGSADDTLLSDMIARAKKAIDKYTRTTFESSVAAIHYFSTICDVDGDTLYLDADLCAITSVKTNCDSGTPTTLTANTDYVTLPRNKTPYYAIKRLGSSAYTWTYTNDPEMGIQVNGNWAYSTTPPDDIIHATIRLVGYYYRQKDAQVFDVTAIPEAGVITVPQGIPADVAKILDEYVSKSYV